MSDAQFFPTSDPNDSRNDNEVDMPVDATPDCISDGNDGPEQQPHNRTFHLFLLLPAELRVLVYEFIISESRVQNIAIDRSRDVIRPIVVVNTREHHISVRALRQTSPEPRAETGRLCNMLPTSHVNDVGADMIDMNEGTIRRRPGRTTPIGLLPYNRDTTFVMDDQTAFHLFLDQSINIGTVAGTLTWLRSVMVYWSTFLHLTSNSNAHNVSRGAQPGAPFVSFPSLRRVLVGFVRRFQDISILEGRYDDVVRELEVVRGQPGDASSALEIRINGIVQDLDPGLRAMILGTIDTTVTQVDDMRQAGIEVIWVMIEAGVVRYGDLLDWSYPGH
ncbi:hypothetical protein GGR57DRAFT_499257 [Xylariaceae sp. FL1272]|nr:hypothetical protein GGR57DRAFT_499257 [Xylariaceae sp. FL1272]